MKCNSCGKEAIKKLLDPYIEELYPEKKNEEEWWCEECYQERLWDI